MASDRKLTVSRTTPFPPENSVNMLSIWRLQSIVETRAATLPTFDPTWYGATPIVLSTMEVELATICASLPVFWPVLKKQLGPYIMVTHEVKITREERRWADGDGDGDEVELRRPTPVPGVFLHPDEDEQLHHDEGPGGGGRAEGRAGSRNHYRSSSSASKAGLDGFTTTTTTVTPSTLSRVTSARTRGDSKQLQDMIA